ncbi:MAG: hypothetical protein CMJ35_08200 [Phycisphaerae bacterium]|nr:hypothetical protein [Phycisphaerae bacterium]MBM91580.1 hypothetical protein [Phycisphaerae bacterium]
MTRKQKQLVRMGLISALMVLGTGIGTAEASGTRWNTRGHTHRHTDSCGCQVTRTAGFITIDGKKTRITSDRGMLAQITQAFRKAGYRARIQDGCVHVDYGHCKPSVRWQAEGYSVRIKRGWDELGLSMRKITRSHYQPVRPMRPMRPITRSRRCW